VSACEAECQVAGDRAVTKCSAGDVLAGVNLDDLYQLVGWWRELGAAFKIQAAAGEGRERAKGECDCSFHGLPRNQ
jgi:hypothetical protein